MKLKLTKRHFEILEFCEVPRLSTEIAQRFGILLSSAYPYLSGLRRHGYLSATAGKKSGKGIAITHYAALQPGEAVQVKGSHIVNAPVDMSMWNMDFMKAAHNPFRIGL